MNNNKQTHGSLKMAKNVNADTLLDCWSCAHSQAGNDRKTGVTVLICSLNNLNAIKRCAKFEYEQVTNKGEDNA